MRYVRSVAQAGTPENACTKHARVFHGNRDFESGEYAEGTYSKSVAAARAC